MSPGGSLCLVGNLDPFDNLQNVYDSRNKAGVKLVVKKTMNNATSMATIAETTTSFEKVFYYSSVGLTILSGVALIVNLYLLNCSRYLRRPIGVNLRLCVSLTASDAAAALCYILSYMINIIIPSDISNCWSLLLEVFKLTTFFASVSILLILALNHYVGIVYPLRRHIITNKSVRITILLSYVVPFAIFFALFCFIPGGFTADIAFGFFNSNGCQSNRILQNPIIRWLIVGPFILFTLGISFLYCHIIYHMSTSTKDPLLKNNHHATTNAKKSYNGKLLGTLALLAGSAVIGWLPTTIFFALICKECVFPVTGSIQVYLTILSHLLNILKLIVDAFIYSSRLVEVRYAMWEFHNSLLESFEGVIAGSRAREIPPEFVKYLNDTKDTRTHRSRRFNQSLQLAAANKHRAITMSLHDTRRNKRDQSNQVSAIDARSAQSVHFHPETIKTAEV